MNKSFEALVADMKELAEHILELEAEKYQEREMIEAYDRADTLFGAVNIKALIAALEREVDIRAQNHSIKLHMVERISQLEKLLRATEESLIAAVDQIADLEASRPCVKLQPRKTAADYVDEESPAALSAR